MINNMKIYEVKERTPQLLEQLLNIWEDSVRATHLFLSDEEGNPYPLLYMKLD